ncbi:hypothetical protein HDV00_005864 [Rhizophlyctis rosea]|nr:hypothetical protein HDV00_005864 [Rhizophlyctis rosea]
MHDTDLENVLTVYDGLSEKAKLDFVELIVRQAALSSPSFLGTVKETLAAETASPISGSPTPSILPDAAKEAIPVAPASVVPPSVKESDLHGQDAWSRVAATISALQATRERSLSRGRSMDSRPETTSSTVVDPAPPPTKIPLPVWNDERRGSASQRSVADRGTRAIDGRRYGGEFVRPGEESAPAPAAGAGEEAGDSHGLDERRGLTTTPRDASMDRTSVVTEHRGREKERTRRDRSHRKGTSTAADEVETVVIRTPDEVRPILQALRRIQKSEAGSLFAEIDIPLTTDTSTPKSDQQSPATTPTTSRSRHPFAHIERQITDILTLAPSIILRTMTPRHPPNFPYLRRSTSRGQSISPSRARPPTPENSLPTAPPTPPHQKDGASQKDPLSNAPALLRIASASSHLATLIESIITHHHTTILSLLSSPADLEEYQKVSERVWESTFGVLKGVKRLREWDAGVGVWEGAKDLYAGLILDVLHFVQGVRVFVEFSGRALAGRNVEMRDEVDGEEGVGHVGGEEGGLPSPPVEVVTPGGVVQPYAPSPSPDLVEVGREGKAKKRKSFSSRIKERFSLLTTPNPDARRVSTSSLSSEDSLHSSNSSHPTRISRMSDHSNIAPPHGPVDYSHRPTSSSPALPDTPTSYTSSRRSIEIPMGRDQHVRGQSFDGGHHGERGRSSLELARPRSSFEAGNYGHVGRSSLDARLGNAFEGRRSRSPGAGGDGVGAGAGGARMRGFSVGRSPLAGGEYRREEETSYPQSFGTLPLPVSSSSLATASQAGMSSTSLPARSESFPTHYTTTPRPHRNSIGGVMDILKPPSNNLSIRVANHPSRNTVSSSWRPTKMPFETDDEEGRLSFDSSRNGEDGEERDGGDSRRVDERDGGADDEDDRFSTLTFNRWSRMVMDVTALPSSNERRRPKSMFEVSSTTTPAPRPAPPRLREEESESEWDGVGVHTDDEGFLAREQGDERQERDFEYPEAGGDGDVEDDGDRDLTIRRRVRGRRSKTPLSPSESVASVGSVGAVVGDEAEVAVGVRRGQRPARPLPPVPVEGEEGDVEDGADAGPATEAMGEEDREPTPPDEEILPPYDTTQHPPPEPHAPVRTSLESDPAPSYTPIHAEYATQPTTALPTHPKPTATPPPPPPQNPPPNNHQKPHPPPPPPPTQKNQLRNLLNILLPPPAPPPNKTIHPPQNRRPQILATHPDLRLAGSVDRGIQSGDDVDEGVVGKNAISVRGDLLYLNEDGREVLVMHMLGDRLHIVAGTVEKLLLRLADENFQDMEYVDCFIQNHSFFIDSLDLLENLVARFHAQPPENPTEGDIEYFNKWRRPIQLKVLTVLSRWVKLQYEDFTENPSLRLALEDFLDQIWTLGYKNECDRIRRVGSLQAMVISSRNKNSPFARYLLPTGHTAPTLLKGRCPFPLSAVSPNDVRALAFGVGVGSGKEGLNDGSPLLDCEARDLARYLSAAAWHAFRSITVADYVGRLVGGEGGSGGGEGKGRIDLFANRSNMLRNWVAMEVCSLGKVKSRRKLIEKFISVAKYCRDNNNFHTTLLIVSGLLSAPVQRLKRTWDAVSTAHTSALTSLEKLLDPSGNMRNYRKALATATTSGVNPATGQVSTPGPCVPFFPVVMKDVTFVMDGNPAFVEGWGEGVNAIVGGSGAGDSMTTLVGGEEGMKLVNFDKYRSLSKIIAKYTSGSEGSVGTSSDRHGAGASSVADFYNGTVGVMHVLPHLLRAVHGGGGPAQHAIAAVGAGAVGKAYWGSNPAELEHVAITVEMRLAFADDDGLGLVMRGGEADGKIGGAGSGKAGMGRCMSLAWSLAGRAEGESD